MSPQLGQSRSLRPLSLLAMLAAAALVPLLAGAQTAPGADDEALAASIVEKADRVRFPGEGFEVNVTITTTTPSGAAEPRNTRFCLRGTTTLS